MALDFTRASSQYLEATGAPITAAPCTLACWFKADDITAQHVLLSVMDDGTGSVDGFYIQAVGNTAGDPIRASVAAAGSFGEAATTTGYSANTWQHACGVYTSATSRAAFLNGDGKGTNATNRAPSGLSRTMVGRYNAGASNVYSDAAIAEAAIWDADLTDAEVASLAAGMSPLLVRPENLVFYAPLFGNNSPETDIVSGLALTYSGSPAKVDHPRILRPSAQILRFPSAAGGGSIESGVGSSAGSATAAAVGASIAATAGAAAGAGTATAVGASTAAAAGTSAGVATAPGVGASTAAADGTSAGSATAAGVGASTAEATGTSTGTSTAAAVGDVAGGVQSGAGTSAGTSTASGVGASTAASVGTSAGTSTASAVGSSSGGVQEGVGTAAGQATAAGVGASTAEAVGTSAGVATATAVGTDAAAQVEATSIAGLRVYAARESQFFFSKRRPTRRRTSRASWPTLRAA